MRKQTFCYFILICMILTVNVTAQKLKYPNTKTVNQTDEYFGTKVSDPYRWSKIWIQPIRNLGLRRKIN